MLVWRTMSKQITIVLPVNVPLHSIRCFYVAFPDRENCSYTVHENKVSFALRNLHELINVLIADDNQYGEGWAIYSEQRWFFYGIILKETFPSPYRIWGHFHFESFFFSYSKVTPLHLTWFFSYNLQHTCITQLASVMKITAFLRIIIDFVAHYCFLHISSQPLWE